VARTELPAGVPSAVGGNASANTLTVGAQNRSDIKRAGPRIVVEAVSSRREDGGFELAPFAGGA
jgi:hypothetical protein